MYKLLRKKVLALTIALSGALPLVLVRCPLQPERRMAMAELAKAPAVPVQTADLPA